MRVDPAGGAPIPQTPAGAPTRPAARAAESTGSAPETTFAPTAGLAQLLEAVRTAPEVRADVIESVAARLQAGELATPEAAAETAKAMLNSGGGG
jgi:hypothetical protein